MGISSIRSLLRFVSPTTVGRFVRAVVVYAVNAVHGAPGRVSPWRHRAHIGIEVLERIPPPLTNSNAAPAVPGVRDVSGLIAPLEHRPPDPELARIGHPVGPVQIAQRARDLLVRASTCLLRAQSGTQVVRGDVGESAAVTATKPTSLARIRGAVVRNYYELPESFANQVGSIVAAAAASLHNPMIADSHGTGYCTTGVADADTGAPGVNDCVVNVGYV